MKTILMSLVVVCGVVFGGCDTAGIPVVVQPPAAQCPVPVTPAPFDVAHPVGSFSGEAIATPATGSATGSAWNLTITEDGDGGFCLNYGNPESCVFDVLPFGQESYRVDLAGTAFRYNAEIWHARGVTLVTHYGQLERGVVDVFITADEGTMVWRLEQVITH